MKLDQAPTLKELKPKLDRVFEAAGPKIVDLDRSWDRDRGTPVYTVEGRYTTRGWTEWTQGFQYGCALLEYDATGDQQFLELGRRRTLEAMAPHLTHTGVHDHGFNNVSTYGNLRRLAREGRMDADDGEMRFYELALQLSGAVHVARWTHINDPSGERRAGYVPSFNGPHSLFSDTIRSMRSPSLAWQLGHMLMGEHDERINLLGRSIQHALSTARFNVYYGEGRDAYDTPENAGRVVHESIFNNNDGRYRCPSTQQGYAPFTTWTRGLSWIVCGFAEQLEFLETVDASALKEIPEGQTEPLPTRDELIRLYRKAAESAAEWHIRHSFTDGMVYWDAGAPGIPADPSYETHTADPYNDHEPIDASAAAITAQGMLRLGNWLRSHGDEERGERFRSAARVIANTLFDEPYLSTDPNHQGLLLHTIYHRPNGWDHIPEGQKVPCGESALWGDYHAMELALLLKREAEGGPYVTFFDRAG
jgi:hypothetical protein